MQGSNGEPSREIQSVLMRHHSEQTINSSDTDTPCPLIHQFPVEILARIFFECLPDPMSVPFDCAQLWTLGRICSRWRSVICLEMPLTWSTIKINFRSSTARAAKLSRHSAEIMRVCIQRTRECPLTIAFTCASDVGATARDDWLRSRVLSRLLPAKGRLKSLEVLNLSLEPQNARSLPRAVDIFEDAPKLTRVTMSSHLSLDTFRLPWKQIIEYRTKLMEVWNCVEVLHHAPHLRALHAKLERARG
ncbi:hypothetical protein GGU10DRAFT_369421, partial [Lentinula aff. detonsa]